jgi:hypothetical protein
VRDVVCIPGEEVYREEHDSLWCAPTPDGTLAWWKEYRNSPLRAQILRFARSRARREWVALRAMAEAGLPVPRPLACMEQRRSGALRASMLVTADIPGQRDLAALVADPTVAPEFLLAASRSVGLLARQMHDAGFVHFRFLARNLLVDVENPERVSVLDTPYVRSWSGRPPAAHCRYDLQTLGCARGGLPVELAYAAIAAYDPSLPAGTCVRTPRRQLKARRILYFSQASCAGHRPKADA